MCGCVYLRREGGGEEGDFLRMFGKAPRRTYELLVGKFSGSRMQLLDQLGRRSQRYAIIREAYAREGPPRVVKMHIQPSTQGGS